MRYVRFMSEYELKRFQAGEELVNDSDWKKFNKSESIGFCFFDDEVTPEKRMEYVSGVVNLDRVVVFEHIGGEPLKKSFACLMNLVAE